MASVKYEDTPAKRFPDKNGVEEKSSHTRG